MIFIELKKVYINTYEILFEVSFLHEKDPFPQISYFWIATLCKNKPEIMLDLLLVESQQNLFNCSQRFYFHPTV